MEQEEALRQWYEQNRRILPWRQDPTPYHVWLSEIMLQQTRVAAVVPYYQRFLAQLPDIPALAAVDPQRLMKLWEGLGYYRRAVNLQKAAVILLRDHDGRLPQQAGQLEQLPGIGRYTAAAIAAIAFQQPCVALDGNLLRIYARLKRDGRPADDRPLRQDAERYFQGLLGRRPGDINQALMDVGETVCLPHGSPLCGQCPLKPYCLSARHGDADRYPVARKKNERPVDRLTVLVMRLGNRVLLRQRPAEGLLGGLYEFPNVPGRLTAGQAGQWCAARGIRAVRITPLPDCRHRFTHREWQMSGYAVEGERTGAMPAELIAVENSALDRDVPIPAAFRGFRQSLNER